MPEPRGDPLSMSELDTLLQLKGAMAAFEFGLDGCLGDHAIRYTDRLDHDILQQLARLCAANLQLARIQASGWHRISGENTLMPLKGFTLIGMDWSVATTEMGNQQLRALVYANAEIEQQAVIQALDQSIARTHP